MDDATDATAPQAQAQALTCRLQAIHDYIAAAARGSASLGPPPPADGIYGRLEFVACADGTLPHKEDLRRHANPAPGIARADAGFVFGPETLAKILPCLPVAKRCWCAPSCLAGGAGGQALHGDCGGPGGEGR